MSSNEAPNKFIDVVDEVRSQLDGNDVSIEKLLNIFSARVYGPMLLVPAFLAVMPTGAIPGIPTITGIIISIVSIQLFVGIKYPWIPKQLKNIELPSATINSSLDFVQTPINKIENHIRPRITLLTKKPLLNLFGFLGVTLGMSMAPLELLPFAVIVPGMSALVLAIGLTMRDGVWLLFSAMLAVITYWLVYLTFLELS